MWKHQGSVMLVQEVEATFIKEDKLRHHWNPADLHRWQEAIARLDSLRQEVAALTAGAPAAGTVQQEHSQASSMTEEAGTPDIIPQEAPEGTVEGLETGRSLDQGQPDNMAAGRLAGTGAESQAHPEEALGSVAERQPAEAMADIGQPAGILHVAPEVEGGPQPEPTEAGKTMSRDDELDASSSNELSQDAQEADLGGDSAVEQGVQDSDGDTQLDSIRDLWDASGKALLQSVQAGNLDDVDWLPGGTPSCEVDVRDADGRTPLHIAAEREQEPHLQS